jgi:hypothetical protein
MNLAHSEIVVSGGDEKRCLVAAVPWISFCDMLNQQLRSFSSVVLCRSMKRMDARWLTPAVNICATINQDLNNVGVAKSRSPLKGVQAPVPWDG